MRRSLIFLSLLVCVVILAAPSFAAQSPETIQPQQTVVSAVSVDQPLELSTQEMAAVTGEHGTVITSVSNPVTAAIAVKLFGGWNNWRGAHIHVVVPFSWRYGGRYDIAVLRL